MNDFDSSSSITDQLFSDPAPAAPSTDYSAPAAPALTPPLPIPASPQPPAATQDLSTPDAWQLPPDPSQPSAVPPAAEAQAPPAAPPAAPVVSDAATLALPPVINSYVEQYGAESTQQLTDMAFNLFGIGQIPEGVAPQTHFLDQLYAFDEAAYDRLVAEVERSHRDQFAARFRDQILAAEGLPTTKEELAALRDYQRYGSRYVSDDEAKGFLGQIPQNLQSTFQRQSEAYRQWLIEQVAGKTMNPELAIEELQRREKDYQRDQAEDQAKTQAQHQREEQVTQRAHQQANQTLAQQRDQIIEQKAKADNIHPEIVRDIYARAGSELEEFANAAMYGYAKNKEEFDLGQAAIKGYQALVEAQKTGSPLQVKQALNGLRILAEQRYAVHLQARRQRAQQQGAQPAPAQQQQQPRQLEGIEQQRQGYRLPNGQDLVEELFR